MIPIRSEEDLKPFLGSFVLFEISNVLYEKETCHLIQGKEIARISKKKYFDEHEAGYKYRFAILRKNKKFNYCYLDDTTVEKIGLKLQDLSEEEHAAVAEELKDCPSKYAAGECFLEGCKLDDVPDTDVKSPPRFQPPVIFSTEQPSFQSESMCSVELKTPISNYFERLDDNLMLGTVLAHLFYKFIALIWKKNSRKEKKCMQGDEDRQYFYEQRQKLSLKLSKTRRELEKYVDKNDPSEIEWAFDGLENYRKVIKKLPTKFERGLAKTKFDKINSRIENFIEEIHEDIDPKLPIEPIEEKAEKETPAETKSGWYQRFFRIGWGQI